MLDHSSATRVATSSNDDCKHHPDHPRVLADTHSIDVLVVDDNALNVKLLRLALEAQGYRVHVAATVMAARIAVVTARPALVLLDVQLPDGDGLTVLRDMRADATLAQVPVLVLSAFASGQDIERAYAAGADMFVAKPTNTRALLHMLSKLLESGTSLPPGNAQ